MRLDSKGFQLFRMGAHHRKDELLVIFHQVHSVACSRRLHSVASTGRPMLNVGTCLVKGDQVETYTHEGSLFLCTLKAHAPVGSFCRSSKHASSMLKRES